MLIGRGSYPEGEQLWRTSFRTAREQAARFDPALVTALDAYAREHTEIRRLDSGGQ